jgi:hypothetical protein
VDRRLLRREVHGHAGRARRQSYYVNESVGIACGFFVAALHRMGLSMRSFGVEIG